MNTQLDIRVLPIADLRPAPYNPRQMLEPDDPAYLKLEKSLRDFGLVEPLVWNQHTGYIVGGHMRLSILKRIGVKEAPVSVVDLTDEQEKALNVILNNREAQGRFEPLMLADVLQELADANQLESSGFDLDDLTTLRFEPAVEKPLEEPPTDHVEIILVTRPEVYQRLAPRLDVLVREFDLVTHVRDVIAR